jgi:hypothetical protein
MKTITRVPEAGSQYRLCEQDRLVPLKILSDQSLTNGQAARTVKRPAGQVLCWQMGENAFLRLRFELHQNFLRKNAWELRQSLALRMPASKRSFAQQPLLLCAPSGARLRFISDFLIPAFS